MCGPTTYRYPVSILLSRAAAAALRFAIQRSQDASALVAPGTMDKKLQRPAALPGVDIFRSRLSEGETGGGYFTTYMIGAGEGSFRCHYRGKRHEQAGRYVVMIERGEFLPTVACSDIRFVAWYISQDVMEQAADERGQSRPLHFARSIMEDPASHRVLTRATTILGSATGALEQQEAMTTLFDLVWADYVDRGRAISEVVAHRGVRRMRDLIHDGVDQEVTLDMLASHSRLNKFYALRAFKRALGITPHEYQRHLRVSKASEMLRAGRSSAEVAHSLGFCDQSHFVRTFRQLVRLTPRQYQMAT